MQISNLLDIFFRTKEGRVVIGQTPNPPLYTAFGLYLVRFFQFQYSDSISIWGVRFSLIYWSYQEISSGVNLWRRLLGGIVLVYVAYSWIGK